MGEKKKRNLTVEKSDGIDSPEYSKNADGENISPLFGDETSFSLSIEKDNDFEPLVESSAEKEPFVIESSLTLEDDEEGGKEDFADLRSPSSQKDEKDSEKPKKAPQKSEDEELKEPGDLIVGLDIGTTKICCIVGEAYDDRLEIIGSGIVPASGIRRGVIYNLENTVSSLKKAIRKAEEASHCDLKHAPVYVGIAGAHISSLNSPGIITVSSKGREVRSSDLIKVQKAAETVKLSDEQRIIHTLPQEYMVDDNPGILNPIGMSAVRLTTTVHVVTASRHAINNLEKSCDRAELNVQKIVLESIASAEAALTKKEKKEGVVLIDIGGGTTDIIVYKNGVVHYTKEFSIGGHTITSDISVGMRTPMAEAEELKELYGRANASAVKSNSVVEVPRMETGVKTSVPQRLLVDIIEARILEIFETTDKCLIKSGYKGSIGAGGVVLTGGTALLPDIADVASQVFGVPARVGFPEDVGGDIDPIYSPRCATSVGLVVYGRNAERDGIATDDSLLGRFRRMLNGII